MAATETADVAARSASGAGPRPDAASSTGVTPVGAAEFAAAMPAALVPGAPLALAVSGGGDSMALLLLADRYMRSRGGRLLVLSVDHGLRPDSADDVAFVAAVCAARGVPHIGLAWDGGPGARGESGLQARARAARYDLLARTCRAHGVVDLLLGHTRDDQIETVFMRAERQSDGAGLSGMAALRVLPDVRLHRPLLGFSRDRLRATLIQAGLGWREDPSNADPRFERVRARCRLAADPALRARTGRQAVAEAGVCGAGLVPEFAVAFSPCGFATFAPGEVAPAAWPRLLSGVVGAVGGAAYPPARSALARAADRMAVGDVFTLGRCRVMPLASRPDRWLAVRENRHLPDIAYDRPGRYLWDGRARLRLADAAFVAETPPFRVVPLAQLPKSGRPGPPSQLSAPIRATLPVVVVGTGSVVTWLGGPPAAGVVLTTGPLRPFSGFV